MEAWKNRNATLRLGVLSHVKELILSMHGVTSNEGRSVLASSNTMVDLHKYLRYGLASTSSNLNLMFKELDLIPSNRNMML